MHLKPIQLRVNHMPSDRYAVVTDAPVFSWSAALQSAAAVTTYRITVTDGNELLWDSGEKKNENAAVYEGKPLSPGMRLTWRLCLTDENGNRGEETACFRVVPKTLRAPWITKADQPKSRPIYLAKQFTIQKDIARADLYVSGIGYQRVSINGRPADNAVLQPAVSNYKEQCYFVTLCAEHLLQRGTNCIGVKLGDGWRQNEGAYLRAVKRKIAFFGTPQLTLELHCKYTDGSTEIIQSDTSWHAFDGGTVRSHLFDGETYDARKEPVGWDTPDFDLSGMPNAVLAETLGEIKPQTIEPITVQRRITPVSKTLIAPETYVFDFGENIAGYPEIKIPNGMAAGEKITMTFAEEIDEDGDLERNSMRGAASLDEYIANGREQDAVWSPAFVYHGFRYMKLCGRYGIPSPDSIAAVVVSGDIAQTGRFTCGSALLNQIQDNILRSERGNLHSIATDCPQRDERMGWLNDATVRFEETPYNFDMSRLFPKIIADIRAEQAADGTITCTAPYVYGNRPADPVCSSYLVLGWQCWLHYADKSLLQQYYNDWKRWNDAIAALSEDGIVSYSCYGDWAGPVDSCQSYENARSSDTPDALMSTGYHYYNYCMLAKMAEVLGDAEEKQRNEAAAAVIKEAFLKKWYDAKTGTVSTGSQGAQSFALWLGILPKEGRQKAADRLHDAVKAIGYRLKCGNLTARYVLEMLSDYGYVDDAFRIMTRETYPSFGYMIQNGATTIWERFELKKNSGMNSHNHPMYGAVGAWFYSRIAGLTPIADGWKQFAVCPKIPTDLLSAKVQLQTVRGDVCVQWFRRYGKLNIQVTVPYGAECFYEYKNDKKILHHGFHHFSYEEQEGKQ